jgi:hypothetical protein
VSGEFRVILSDLADVARVLQSESAALEKLMSGAGRPAPVDTGDQSLNLTLATVLDDLTFLHSSMAASMADHADKLRQAHDTYQQVNQSMRELFEDLVPAD